MSFVLRHLEESPVGPDSHRAHANEDVAERNHEQRAPRPVHVSAIEAARAVVGGFSYRFTGKPVDTASYEMSQRMTSECIATQKDDVRSEEKRSDSDSKMLRA